MRSDSIILICNQCQHKFWFYFTYGCMKNGKAITACPNCGSGVQIIHSEILEDGSAAIDFVGAKRGLFLSIINHEDIE